MADKSLEFNFGQIAGASAHGFDALRVLVRHLGGLADDYDRGATASFMATLSELVPSLEPVESSPAHAADGESADQGESSVEPASEEVIEGEFSKVLNDEDGRRKFFAAFNELSKKAPMQGRLMRQGALTTLFSHFEGVLAQLVHAYYERYPASLPAEDRTLTLADLRLLGSVSDAEKLIVEKEVDSVLRESTEEQIAYFGKRLKIDIAAVKHLVPLLIEVSQRRNIHVHNHGKVNRQYLTAVSRDLVERFKATDGKTLELTSDYLSDAIDTVDAVATILGQSCWRKWGTAAEADDRVVLATYEALREGRYAFVKEIAGFIASVRSAEEVCRRIVAVNHAIALRDTGDHDGAANVLSELDWSATSLKFGLALSVLQDDKVKFRQLLPRAVASEEIKVEALLEWPLFKPWRQEAWFDDVVAELRKTMESDA